MSCQNVNRQVYNSIVLASDDQTVYLTVSSTRFVLSDGVFEVENQSKINLFLEMSIVTIFSLKIVSDGSGRLVAYNLSTKKVKFL